jgi:hypothetical protein
MKLIISLIAVIILFQSCSKQELTLDKEYVIFGKYYGECLTNCASFYKITGSESTMDTAINYYPSTVGFNFDLTLPDAKFQLVKNLKDEVPAELLNSNSQSFGCPDCHDQGGWYLETTVNGIKTYWIIDADTGQLPEYLTDFILELQIALDNLQS